MKTTLLKYASFMTATLAVMGTVATASAAAQIQVNTRARVNASTSMPGVMSGMHMGSTTREQNMSDRQGQQVGKIEDKAGEEISARINALNTLSNRLGEVKNISADEKANISSEISDLTGHLNGLHMKIQADASSTVLGVSGAVSSSSPLGEDFHSITKEYRVYALVIPQTQILAAADRINTIVDSLTTLSAKLQTRIASATSSKSMTSMQASLADLNSKIADAKVQAALATSSVSGLTPDNGDTTVSAHNTTALKAGRAAIAAAQKDIAAADKDAHMIVAAISGPHMNAGMNSTTTMKASI